MKGRHHRLVRDAYCVLAAVACGLCLPGCEVQPYRPSSIAQTAIPASSPAVQRPRPIAVASVARKPQPTQKTVARIAAVATAAPRPRSSRRSLASDARCDLRDTCAGGGLPAARAATPTKAIQGITAVAQPPAAQTHVAVLQTVSLKPALPFPSAISGPKRRMPSAMLKPKRCAMPAAPAARTSTASSGPRRICFGSSRYSLPP